MRNFSNLIALSFSFYLSMQARAAQAADDGFTGPTWVATFGEVSPNEMTQDKAIAYRYLLKSKHIDVTQNQKLAALWSLNGTLPLIGDGYFLLSKNAALGINTPCLYEMATMKDFCVTSSREIRSLQNNDSLPDRVRRNAKLTTMMALKNISADQIDKLKEETTRVQDEIVMKTSDDKIPPNQYKLLGELKGFLEGLDPHSDLMSEDDFFSALDYNLTVTKDNDVVTIKFDRFGDHLSNRIAAELKKLYNYGDKILLDLRDNGGGRVDEAIGLTKLFLGKRYESIDGGKLLYTVSNESNHAVKQKISHPVFETYYENAPLAILVNQKSASASELVAGLLQQEGRAYLIGNITYGKGTYLDVVPVISRKVVAIITSRYLFMRNAKTAQINGLVPDMAFLLNDEEHAQTLREGDYPNALKPSEFIQTDKNPRRELRADVRLCGKQLASERGSHPLKDASEAIELGKTYLRHCYSIEENQALGIAR